MKSRVMLISVGTLVRDAEIDILDFDLQLAMKLNLELLRFNTCLKN